MWDKAMDLGVPDDSVVDALDLAYRVGRERQTESLIKRMPQLFYGCSVRRSASKL